ncbi:MAG TPA: acyl-CoA dehydrogenase family protein [Flavobacteriaceae bacterium]|nr:acyl-CoA dehydrogenase family protein [Flavobacteriaceae bacterium]
MANKALKGGEFIIKESSYEDVFTPEDLNEEQKMMRDSVKEFVDREMTPNREKFEEHNYALTEEVMRKAGELGFLGITVPEEYEGLGMEFTSSVLVTDYFSGATGSMATAYGAHTGIGTLPIALYGNEEQKKKYLPKLATGEWFGSYALTEPTAGSDANSGKTKAELTDDGKHYLINGQKMWISNAGFCHLFIVFARIEDDKYISSFIVEYDKDNPNGIKLGNEENKLGIHSSSTRQVFFEDTKVPVENMLSQRGQGFKIAMNILNIGRIKLGAACLDAQRRLTTQAVQYANEREQFDTKIANFEAVKSKLASMAMSAYVGESATYRAAKLIEFRKQEFIEDGMSPNEAELKAVEDFAVECCLLKVAGSEDMQNCSDEGLQIYGGMGYSKEAPMEAAWRDARITRIYEGTNEINRMHSVGMLLKKALKGELDLMTPAKAIQDELTSIPSFDTPDYTEALAQEKEILPKLKKAFLMVAGSAVEKYGADLEEQQNLLLAAADMLIEIFMVESALLRTEKNIKTKGEESQKGQIAMTKLYMYEAVSLISQKGKEAIITFATGDEQRMLLMGLRRFTKYQKYPNISELKNSIANQLIEENEYCF